MSYSRTVGLVFTAVIVAFTLSACSGDASREHEQNEHDEHASGKSAETATVKATGNLVTVNMITDSKGERYDPVEVSAERGDSLVFALQSGVHNVHFLAAKNPKGTKLPPMGAYLQLPGQKTAYLIDFPAGRYYYQCDIHVQLGMVGYVNVVVD